MTTTIADPQPPPAPAAEPLLPPALRLLRTVITAPEPRYLNLYSEVCRQTDQPGHRPEQLIALSARFTPRGLSLNRYDSPLTWRADRGEQFYAAAVAAAPTAAVAQWLESPQSPARRWAADPARWFQYLAVDFDRRIYKLYRFLLDGTSFMEDVDLAQGPERLRAQSYIDCLELPLENPDAAQNTLYFKLRISDVAQLLHPDYRPHPDIRLPPLGLLPDPERALRTLRGWLEGYVPPVEPVVKIRWDRPEAGATSVNLGRRGLPLLAQAEVLEQLEVAFGGPSGELRRWLERVAPFAPRISYLCVGPDFVTVYYKCGPDVGF